MKKVTKKLVFGTISLLLAAAFTGCSDGSDNPDKPKQTEDYPNYLIEGLIYPYEGEDTVSEVSGNLVDNGDADGGSADGSVFVSFGKEEGVTVDAVDGGATGKCYKITQAGDGEWQEFNFDITKLYGQGKSYLLSFKLKADPDAETNNRKSKGEALSVSYSLYSGAVKNWAVKNNKEHYDYDDSDDSIKSPWGAEFSDSEEIYCTEETGLEEGDLSTSSPIADETWTQYDFVIPSTQIEAVVNNTGVYRFQIALSMGANAVGGYSYLLDDIVIKDLNEDNLRVGQTWKDPNAVEPEDPEEEEDE